MICDNPECEFHIPAPNNREDAPYVRVAVPIPATGVRPGQFGKETITHVERHLYLTRRGGRIYLCPRCHAAAQTVA